YHAHQGRSTVSLTLLIYWYFSTISLLLNHPAHPALDSLSLHDALPISWRRRKILKRPETARCAGSASPHPAVSAAFTIKRKGSRSEEHTSELQSRFDLVCRLLLEKKNSDTRSFHAVPTLLTLGFA